MKIILFLVTIICKLFKNYSCIMFSKVTNLFRTEDSEDDVENQEDEIGSEELSRDSNEKSFSTTEVLIFRLEGSGDFPVLSLDYKISFLDYPSIDCFKNAPKFAFMFPASIDQLNSSKPTLGINAYDKDDLKASSLVDVSDLISTMGQKLMATENFPISCEMKKSVDLHNKNSESIGAMKIKLVLSCMGASYVTDIRQKRRGSLPGSTSTRHSSASSITSKASNSAAKYDEFCAVVNGHNLQIRMLKKPSSRSNNETDSCTSRKSQNSRNSANFTVNNCQLSDHDHLNTTVNVTSDPEAPDSAEDSFTIVIGKENEVDKGRLEINLKAPKPLQAEDFKRPSKSVQTQTDAALNQAPKKGKKPARKY